MIAVLAPRIAAAFSRVRDLAAGRSFARLRRGVAANIAGQIVTVVIQLVTLPVLIRQWGTGLYGLWLLLTAVPAYLSMADLGFATAATADMTVALARGDTASAQRIHQSALVAIVTVTLGALGLSLLVVYGLPEVPGAAQIGEADARRALAALCVATLATLGWSAFSSALKADGQYAAATVWGDTIRLLDAALVLGAVLASGCGLATAAMLSAFVRCAGLAIGAAMTVRRVPWVHLSFAEASRAEIERLARPAVAVMALPAGYALSLQGVTVAIGVALDLNTVAVFGAIRTVGRVANQAVSLLNHASMPELARAVGAGDAARVATIVRTNVAATIVVAGGIYAVVLAQGPSLLTLWSHGRLSTSRYILAVLALSCAIQAIWNGLGNLLLAVNAHAKYAAAFLAASALSVIGSFLAAKAAGIGGVGYVLVLSEAVMLVVVSREVWSRFLSTQATG